MARRINLDDLEAGVRRGSRAHMARAITLVESRLPAHRELSHELLGRLAGAAGTNAVRVGISGVPGAGKSTFINAMGLRLVEQGHRVAVLAVDPSSPATGGSVLGDRTRMGELTTHEAAFVRPSPTANHLGGVARATREAMVVVEAAGYDVVIVETVGVGQSEVAVADMVDTFLMLALARSGDQLQGIKRGILELADVIAVNKADGENAGEARVTARELSIAMKLISGESGKRRVPVLTCSAIERIGLDEVWAAVLEHRAYLEESVGLAEFRCAQQKRWMWAMVEATVLDALRGVGRMRDVGRAVETAIERQELGALEGAAQVLEAFVEEVPNLGWQDFRA
ncbi:methylmalonyl Co-A mutase-associated GTPase MeaB [Aestuariimicrobium ganziense]|uniref:methylmalonyl Co-A mutase-associated GTPase MeaB n=1 Tax=Aestuariimicrobium ganziense TaxID=2773677 RepID=UPI0019436682|nr:methylmalonyl Co-A mutase-associated GTPase MeaB [Aestuariimicrobium ganziense]